MLKKIVIFLVILILAVFIASRGKNYPLDEISYGVTFSIKHARWLVEEKWQDNYLSILDDLQVKKLRIPAYWDEIQKNSQEIYDFSDLKWMIGEAGKRNAKIILAVGYRLPRWPECHAPSWTSGLAQTERDEKLLSYMKKTVLEFKNNENIIAWQIENEPFLPHFGECPPLDKVFLDKEIALVKKLDERPIVITDSGELSLWVDAAKRSDIFGTSMYLNTYSQYLKSYLSYPIGGWFFHLKRNWTRPFAPHQEMVVIEMQAEPWGPISYIDMTEKEKERTMDIEKLRKILALGQKSGFSEFYLWGAEWWYWEKNIKNNPSYWDEAKKIFNKN